jgi:hypothetical protein
LPEDVVDVLKIERGIPMPKRRAAPRKYPFDKMKAGDSFFIETAADRSRAVVQASVAATARARGVQITTRTVDGGIRVWRTA